jgi:hypothetical protein
MKTLLQTLLFFLLVTPICFGQSGYVDRNISKVSTDSTNLIKRIDHIAAYYNSITEVDSMQKLFSGVLGLPQLLSPAIRDIVSPPNSKFYNTAVYLGNVYLEFITFNLETLNPPRPTYIPYFNAFAFTNEITNTAAILDSRSMPRSQVIDYLCREPDQLTPILFSTISLDYFNNNDILIFFCRYYPKAFNCQSLDFGDLPAITNPDSLHIYFGNLVESINGGPLTLKKVKNLVLTSNYFEFYRQILNTLFSPTEEDEPGKWSPTAGPSLILQSSQTAIKLTTINISVGSLQTAKDFLIEKGLGFEEGENYLKLNLSTNIGMDIILTDITTSVDDEINYTPSDYVLYNNYPNPFNPSTKIKCSVPQTSQIQIKVFDVLGNEIETLVSEEKPAGTYELTWNAANLSSGVYFYQLIAGNNILTKKMVLLK